MNHMACRNQLLQCMYLIYVCIVPTIIQVQYVLYACMRGCIHVCMCACMYIYMYACMHLCMKFMYKLFACMYGGNSYICMYACIHVPFFLFIFVSLQDFMLYTFSFLHASMYAWMHIGCIHCTNGLRTATSNVLVLVLD